MAPCNFHPRSPRRPLAVIVACAPAFLVPTAASAVDPVAAASAPPMTERPNQGLLRTGIGIAASGYGVSALLGGTMMFMCSSAFPSLSGSARGPAGSCTPPPSTTAWLLVPYAGPLVAAGRETDDVNRVWDVVLSGLQIVGTGLIAAAFLFPETRPAPAAPAFSVTAVPLPGGGAVAAHASL